MVQVKTSDIINITLFEMPLWKQTLDDANTLLLLVENHLLLLLYLMMRTAVERSGW